MINSKNSLKPRNHSSSLTTKPLSILLVSSHRSDSILIGNLLAQLKTRNYLLQRATDIKHALQIIANHSCDIVLMSYHWGQFRIGGKFIQKAKSLDPQIPVVIFTPDVEEDVETQIVTLGAADYVSLSELTPKLLDRAIRFSLQRKAKERLLEQLAHNDFLTGLPNRMLLQDRLRQFIKSAEREHNQFTMMLVDINNFKEVNDTFGHQAGDQVLKQFAQRLKRAIRKSDTVARVGGDEFVLLFNKVGDPSLIEQLTHKLIGEIQPEFEIGKEKMAVECSVGVAVYPEAGKDAKTLQRNADTAMYRAKQGEGSRFQFYTPDLDQTQIQPASIDTDFLSALANNQIGLYFNPRISAENDRIVGIEVNPYRDHPEHGLLEYDDFHWRRLDRDISSRFIEWLLATCLEYFKQLTIGPGVKLILNIEFQDLLNPGFARMVSAKLKRYGISGKQIEFDLSNIRLDDYPTSMLALSLADLQRQGITFGMNGFGVDHLPLLKLDDLPISVFKLDRRFVENLYKTGQASELIEAQVKFAQHLGKTIAVEGDHKELPIKQIKALGFDYYKSIFSVDMDSLTQMQSLLKENADEVQSLPDIRA